MTAINCYLPRVSSLLWRLQGIRALCRAAAAGYSGGGLGHGSGGVAFAILLRLGAFLHQPRRRLGLAPSPINRDDAPRPIRAASLRAGLVVIERRAVETTGIVRPFPVDGACSRTARRETRWGRGFRRCDKAESFKFARRRLPTRLRLFDCDE